MAKRGKRAESNPDANGQADSITISKKTEFALRTLKGDVAKRLLDHFQRQLRLWATQTESEQRETITNYTHEADVIIDECTRIVGAGGNRFLPLKLTNFQLGDGHFRGTVQTLDKHDSTLLCLNHAVGVTLPLVLTEVERYKGERATLEADVVGDLRIPKSGRGAPSDPEAEAQLGRGGIKQHIPEKVQPLPEDLGPMWDNARPAE